MITRDEFEILVSARCREAVEANIARDPLAVALDKRVPHAHLVASQVKYLQRSEKKLPSYHAARCIIPSLAFEQSSSEACAATKSWSGGLCLDMTCGLGVDALALAKGFDRVVALERDPVLADVARYNFSLLGASNIEVVCAQSEQYVTSFAGTADMVYADPDRRGADNRRLYLPGECSPDVVSLMAALRSVAPRVVVKCSPLFDVDEAFRLFGDGTCVEVLSLDGECKEVVIETGDAVAGPRVAAHAVGACRIERDMPSERSAPAEPEDSYRYLIVPDVALQKSRLAVDHYTSAGAWIEDDNGYAFADRLPAEPFGKVYGIASMRPYEPRRIRKELSSEGVRGVEIMHRLFPHGTQAIAGALGVREGGVRRWAFTSVRGRLVSLRLDNPDF